MRGARAKSNASMAIEQQRYSQDFDRQVRVNKTFHLGDLVFIDKPPHAATLDTDAAQTALSTYNRLMSQNLGFFCVVAVCLRSLVIDEHGVDNAFSTDCAARAAHKEHPVLTGSSRIRQQSKKKPQRYLTIHTMRIKQCRSRKDQTKQCHIGIYRR